jgi:hypothetical protein
VLTNRAFVEGIDLESLRFDPAQMRERYAACAGDERLYEWSLDPLALRRFETAPAEAGLTAPPAEEAAALAEQEVAL